MLTINNSDILLTRGDTCDITVSFTDSDGATYTPSDTDTIYFRMKRVITNATSDVALEKTLTLSDDVATLHLDEADTESLYFGDYRYEIEIVTEDDYHYTVIADARFIIGKEVENHE